MPFFLFHRWFFSIALALSSVGILAAEPRLAVFFGDSLTAGYGLENPAEEAYPALLQRKISAAHLDWRVVNAGLSGETTAGGLRRIDWVLRQPVDLFVLALGGNDFLRGLDPAMTRANLQGIIDRVQSKYPHARIVLAGMLAPRNLGADYVAQVRALYSGLAEENRIPLVSFLLEGVGGHVELNQSDGIHPTAKGHAIVAENVWKVVSPLL